MTQGSVPGTEEAEGTALCVAAWQLKPGGYGDTDLCRKICRGSGPVKRRKHENQCLSNSVLGGDRELLESCKDGDIPFVVQNTAPQVTFMKDTAVFDMPALFETIDEVREHVDNLEFMELMQQVYHDGGYELLGYADQGFRVMTTNKKSGESCRF